jgi:hypothetical protein
MSFHLKLKTGFFKKEPIEMEVFRDNLILETVSHRRIIINNEDILSIDVINKYQSPELEIHTKRRNYIIYLEDLSQEEEFYRNLSKLFQDKFKC